MNNFDAIIVGGGHNGLIASAYLQKAGLRTLVLERRPFVGGCAATEYDILPGYKVDTAAFAMGNLHPGVEEDLRLGSYGLSYVEWDPLSFTPFQDGKYLFIYQNVGKTQKEFRKFSEKDARAYPKYLEFISLFAKAIEKIVWTPPTSAFEIESKLDGKGKQFLEMRYRSASDVLDDFFESEEIKGTLGWHSAINLNGGPSSEGTAWNLGVSAVVFSKFRIPFGGIGALSNALAKAALGLGVEIVTGAEVARINVKSGKVIGVYLKGGKSKELFSNIVISDVDPKRTFQKLLFQNDITDIKFKHAIDNLRVNGVGTKVICSLKKLPNFKALPGDKPGPQHKLFNIVPSLEYMDRAWEEAKNGDPSSKPMISGYIPSLSDPSLSPAGGHLAEIWVQYTPYNLRKGGWTPEKKESYRKVILDTLEEYAPGFAGQISQEVILTPQDLESRFSLTEGQSYHIDMQNDQRFMFASNRTPIAGLYLCGAGCSPPGVNGAPGYNAAETVINDVMRKAF
jgi:phytoene dehydrogenase-like protein